MSENIPVGISACLLGEAVRYDGGHKRLAFAVEELSPWVAFEPVCPELGIGLPVLFIATLIVGAIVNFVIGQLVEKTGLSGTDRVLGVCFGALRGVLIVAAILFFLDSFTGVSKSEDWSKSQLIPQFSFIIRWFFDYLQSSSSFLPRA